MSVGHVPFEGFELLATVFDRIHFVEGQRVELSVERIHRISLLVQRVAGLN